MFLKDKLNIFYHPTTTMFLDDDPAFLNALPLRVHEDILFAALPDPALALSHLFEISKQNPDDNLYQLLIDEYDTTCKTKLNINDLKDNLSKSNRFSQPSVIVVDYGMPKMNGVEFCKQINDKAIKKILLTGAADTKIGVQALNDGIIDYYLTKNASNILDQLSQTVFQLQTQYFDEKAIKVRENLKLHYPFLEEPRLASYFKKLCEQEAIVEYYFTPHPCGYLLVDGDGNLSQLLVYSDKELEIHRELAADQDAAAELLQLIDKREQIPFFHLAKDGYYCPEAKNNWQDYFYPAAKVTGKIGGLYCALINPANLRKQPSIVSFNQYIEAMITAPTFQQRQNLPFTNLVH